MPPSKTRNFIQDKGYNAAEPLVRFRAVKFVSAETVGPVEDEADVIAGVVQHDVTEAELAKGKGASIAVEGDTLMESADETTIGALAGLTDDGLVVDADTGARVIGHIVEAASGAGEYSRVHLNLNGAVL